MSKQRNSYHEPTIRSRHWFVVWKAFYGTNEMKRANCTQKKVTISPPWIILAHYPGGDRRNALHFSLHVKRFYAFQIHPQQHMCPPGGASAENLAWKNVHGVVMHRDDASACNSPTTSALCVNDSQRKGAGGRSGVCMQFTFTTFARVENTLIHSDRIPNPASVVFASHFSHSFCR